MSNYADLRELHRFGVLQEANRLFFHPLGLAMVWELPRDDADQIVPRVVGFLTAQDDPEGWAFTDLSDTESRLNQERVDELRNRFRAARKALFGSDVQPIGSKLPLEAAEETSCPTKSP